MRVHVLVRLLSLSLLTTPALASDDILLVTGSRIVRDGPTANSPVVRLDEHSIANSGHSNVEDLIRQLPQSVAAHSPGVNLGNPGVATLNLRGLNQVRTLVLVDGKRYVPYDYGGAVDVNNIPLALLESVEVLTGGGSAVYGSDAMAGVVNFRLRRDFQGLSLGAHFRQTERDDGRTVDYTLLAGSAFGGGRGNASLFVGWTDRGQVSTADRSFSRFALATASGDIGGSIVDTQGTLFCIPGCFPTTGGGPQSFMSFQPNGDLAPTGSRMFNYNLYNYLQTPQKRIHGTALIDYDLTGSVRMFGRLTGAESKVDTAIAPSGTFFTRTFQIPLSSPFLSAQARQVLTDRIVNGTGAAGTDGLPDPQYDTDGDGQIDPDAMVTEFFARRTLDVGPRQTFNRTLAWQALAGLTGALGSAWNWEVSFQHAQSRLTHDYTNDVSEARMQSSILGCPPGSPPGCVPGNFFGDGNLSAEAADFIRLDLRDEKFTDQQVWMASLTGTLGRMGLAAGAEYRRERSHSDPDECLRTPGCSGGYGSVQPVDNRYSAREIFGEVLMPLAEGRSWAERLDLETGLRLSDYSNIGGVASWKFGGGWQPSAAPVRLHAMYQRAVRAPNIFEFGSPIQRNLAAASGDPCSGIVSGPLRELCIATGVPVAIIDAGAVPDINGQVNVFQGGNPDLEEESSDTYTAGLTFAPLPGLRMQLDYYRIRIEGAITTIGPNDVLRACYNPEFNPGYDPTSPACALVFRNPVTGGLVGDSNYGISNRNENIAFLRTEGVDLTMSYRLAVADLGEFEFSFLGTRVVRNNRKVTEELPARECAGRYGSSCGSPDPKLRFLQQTNWRVGDFDLGYRWRYVSETQFDNPAAAAPQFRQMSDRHYLDLLLGWRPQRFKGLSVRVGVENLFDRDPPLVGEDAGPTDRNSGNTYPGTFDVLGRTYFLTATQRF